MSSTVSVKFSDAEVRRQAARPEVRDLRDPRHPGLYLRLWQNRERGTWYLVRGKVWLQIARWPDVGVSALLGELPAIQLRLARDPAASVRAGELATAGAVLDWYGDRAARDRTLSTKRKMAVRTVIGCHLRPRLGDTPVLMLSRAVLDRDLVWPLQEQLSVSYVRQILVLLLTAFRKAHKVGQISTNPLDGLRFVDFIQAKIPPKPARLRGVQLRDLLAQLAAVFGEEPADAMLALMMLCHGTRVGETRQARWPEISLADGEWFIPAERTKTRTEHRVPLTTQACALLARYRATQSAKGYDGVYLFPSKRKSALSESQASQVFVRLGQGEWTSHDLRKVARTGWTDLGIDAHIGELLLNHTLGKIAGAYINTRARNQRMEALEKWHAWLDGLGFQQIHGSTDAQSDSPTETLQPSNGAACAVGSDFAPGEVSK